MNVETNEIITTTPTKNTRVDIMKSVSPCHEQIITPSCHVRVTGNVHTSTLFTPTCSIQFLIDQVRRDLVTTIRDRFQVLADGLEEHGDEQLEKHKISQTTEFKLPTRVYVEHGDIRLCDYISEGDTLHDVIDNVNSVLISDFKEEDLILPEGSTPLTSQESKASIAQPESIEAKGLLAWIFSFFAILLAYFRK
jgi:hypothetical protein